MIGLAYLYILRPHSTHTRDTQTETYRIEDVRLSTPVKACNRIEALIPAADNGTDSIGLEAVDYDLYDPHVGGGCRDSGVQMTRSVC